MIYSNSKAGKNPTADSKARGKVLGLRFQSGEQFESFDLSTIEVLASLILKKRKFRFFDSKAIKDEILGLRF